MGNSSSPPIIITNRLGKHLQDLTPSLRFITMRPLRRREIRWVRSENIRLQTISTLSKQQTDIFLKEFDETWDQIASVAQ